jgi:hypothetical protein
MNPLNGVGLVFEERDGAMPAFLGTCFAYRNRAYFLTAAHVVADRQLARLAVLSPREGVFSTPRAVHLHPEADIAILVLHPPGREIIEPFWGSVSNYALGEEYFAYGFPEDYRGPRQGQPTARLFRGYFQRFMPHVSHMRYKYIAGELSTPCPGGLSGGPLFRPGAQVMLTGLVTENIEAATFLDSQEVVVAEGKVVNEHYRRVINYGIALMLDQVESWINEYVPARERP